jgi:hypothetical protein
MIQLKKEHTRRNTPNEFYKNWPTMRGNVIASEEEKDNGKPTTPSIISTQVLMNRISPVLLYQTLSKYKFYWSNTAKSWNTLNDGILPNSKCTQRVIAYAETSFAMLALPLKV